MADDSPTIEVYRTGLGRQLCADSRDVLALSLAATRNAPAETTRFGVFRM